MYHAVLITEEITRGDLKAAAIQSTFTVMLTKKFLNQNIRKLSCEKKVFTLKSSTKGSEQADNLWIKL